MVISSIADLCLVCNAVAGDICTSVDKQVWFWLRTEIKVFGFQLENNTSKYLYIYFSYVWNGEVLYIVLLSNSAICLSSEITRYLIVFCSLCCLRKHRNTTLLAELSFTLVLQAPILSDSCRGFYINLYFYSRPVLFIWGKEVTAF